MAKQSVRLTNASVVAALNNKADIELENSTRANAIESLANSASVTANAASKVADAAVDLIEVQLPLKVNKSGDTFNGNVVVDGNLMVTGEINATIKGSSESAVSATKDSNGNVIVDTYLKKNGDTITGSIQQSIGNVITASSNSNYTAFLGGMDTGYENLNGGSIALFGKDYSDSSRGGFILRAANGSNGVNFTGLPNGTLLWGGIPMEQYDKVGTNYIKYASGLLICWWRAPLQGSWTFPHAFSEIPSIIACPRVEGTNLSVHVCGETTTGCSFGFSGTVGGNLIAIGFWK